MRDGSHQQAGTRHSGTGRRPDRRRQELIAQFQDPEHGYFLNPQDNDSDAEYQGDVTEELEICNYYTEKNVFWVPQLACWQTPRDNATLTPGTEIEIKNCRILPIPTPFAVWFHDEHC
jgi:hypothetical protein